MRSTKNYIKRVHHSLLRVVYSLCCFVICVASVFTTTKATAQINAHNVLNMGRTALYYDDYVTAISHFNHAIEARPNMAEAYYCRAYAKFSLEDYKGAEEDCLTAITLNPFRNEYYQLRGLCRINTKNWTGAIEDYNTVLSEQPNNQAAVFNRTLCYLEINNYDLAQSSIDEFVKRWPKYTRGYLTKAQVYIEKGDTLGGIAIIDTLLTLSHTEAEAWSVKGRFAVASEDYLLADSCLTRAIALRPTDATNYLSRAIARHGLNRYSGALTDYDRVIELIPEHFVAHYNRGLLRALVGDDNRAIEDFNFVLGIEPDNELAIFNRAQLREQTGDFRGAVKDYSRLIAAYPNFIYGYAARARCRRRIGDIRGALSDETKVQRADLDLLFGNRVRNVKKVRRRSDHSLDQYQQLVAEDADTTRTFMGEFSGKVQNRHVEREILPMFSLSIAHTPTSGYHSIGYIPEVEDINRKYVPKGRLQFTADKHIDLQDGTYGTQTLQAINTQLAANADCRYGLILRAAVHRQIYDLQSALADIDAALAMDTTSVLALSLKATILCELQEQQTHNLINPDQSEIYQGQHTRPSTDNIQYNYYQALNVLNQALRIAPDNALVYYNRGCLNVTMGNYKAAIEDFEAATTLDPKLAEAYYNQAVVYLRMDNKSLAIPLLSRAGEIGLFKAYSLLKQANK